MTIQIAKTISIDSRNTLVRNRDALQQKHAVQIFFPKSLVRGDKQDMIIKGGVTGTTNAEREIDNILIGWRQEFEAFKQRQAYRKAQRRVAATEQPTYFPTIAEAYSTKSNTSKPKPKSNNPFAVLENQEVNTTETDAKQTKSAPKSKTLSGWATVAAKAPVKHNTTHTAELPKTFNWSDIAMDEESDDDDW